LNGLFDKESDAINPRSFSLRNPLVGSNLLSQRKIYLWVGLLWVIPFFLNFSIIPAATSFPKFPLLFLVLTFAVVGSIAYSVPPIRLKTRPFFDLLNTFLIIGFLIPLYIAILGTNTIVSINLVFFGIIFGILLVLGIHLPTIMTDLETDLASGERTTATFLGWKNSAYLTSIAILVRVLGFALINIIFMNDGILVPNILPFFLGIVELSLALNLAWKKNREASILLWKVVIVTSIVGGIIFGLLYIP
jgi:chlorophyll synthase